MITHTWDVSEKERSTHTVSICEYALSSILNIILLMLPYSLPNYFHFIFVFSPSLDFSFFLSGLLCFFYLFLLFLLLAPLPSSSSSSCPPPSSFSAFSCSFFFFSFFFSFFLFFFPFILYHLLFFLLLSNYFPLSSVLRLFFVRCWTQGKPEKLVYLRKVKMWYLSETCSPLDNLRPDGHVFGSVSERENHDVSLR